MGKDDVHGCCKIVDTGTYEELINRGHDLSIISHPGVEDESNDEKSDVIDVKEVNDRRNTISAADNVTISKADFHADPDCHISLEEDPTLLLEHSIPVSPEPSQDNLYTSRTLHRQLSTDEAMSTGSVPRITYMTYFKSVNSPLLLALALGSYFASNGSQFFQQLIIAKWTESAACGTIAAAISAKYSHQLVLAAVGVSISMYLRSFLTMIVGVRASKTIHNAMLKSVFGAPISFFSSTPSGQLLTRFGKELEVVDRSLPDGIASVLYCFLQVFFSTLALA
jgi:hypothetical protein